MGGCDKTTPALLMGAASANIPAIYVTAGRCCAATTGASRSAAAPTCGSSGTDARAGHDRRVRAGRTRVRHRPLPGTLHDDGDRLHHDLGRRGARHDAARVASIPAVDSPTTGWPRPAAAASWPWPGRTSPRTRSSPGEAFEDAVATVALGGSTNAFIHLDRDGRRRARGPDPGRLRRDLAPRAVAGQHPAEREVPDGGLLLRRRAARAARPADQAPGALHPDR